MSTPLDGRSLTLTPVDFPEWKHKVLKFVASLLLIKRANYILVIHSLEKN
jgi:hypothetical protein